MLPMELHSVLVTCIILLATYLFLQIPNLLLMIKKKKLPPGPKGFPLIGSFLTIGDRAHESLARLARTYGPLMTIKLGLVNVIVVSSPEMAKEIFQKQDTHFIGRPVPDAVTAETGYERALPWLTAGPHWKKLRKICNAHILSPQKLDSMQELRDQAMKNMIGRVLAAQETGQAVPIRGLVFATAVQLLSNSVFSEDMLDPGSESMDELQTLNANIMWLVGKPNLADYFPFLRAFDVHGIKREIRVSYNRLHELIDDMIHRRIEGRSCADRRGDILDSLLDYTEDEGANGLTRQDVKLLITEIFIAGTDTSVVTVEWVMAELLHNPIVLSKVKQELSEKITPGKTVQEQDIPQLPYLTAVIKETMRLHPTSPLLLPRRAEQETQVQGYTIPKHTQILVNFWSISRDGNYWDEPMRFVPERFLDSDIDFRGGKDYRFVPFGAGRRICPGLNLAVRMVSLPVATLVQNFDWELPKGMVSNEMDMRDEFGVTLRKAEPFYAIPLRNRAL